MTVVCVYFKHYLFISVPSSVHMSHFKVLKTPTKFIYEIWKGCQNLRQDSLWISVIDILGPLLFHLDEQKRLNVPTWA